MKPFGKYTILAAAAIGMAVMLYFGYSTQEGIYLFPAVLLGTVILIQLLPKTIPKHLDTNDVKPVGNHVPLGIDADLNNFSIRETISYNKLRNLLLLCIHSKARPWWLLLVANSLLVCYLVVFELEESITKSNVVAAYYSTFHAYVADHLVYTLSYLLVTAVVTWQVTKSATQRLVRDYFNGGLGIVSILVLAVHVGLVLASGAVAGQVIVFKVGMDYLNKDFGVITDAQVVADTLRENNRVGEVIKASDSRGRQLYRQMLTKPINAGGFYREDVTNFVLNNISPTPERIAATNLYLVGDNVVIGNIDQDEIAVLAPVLGKLLVSEYFSPRVIKSDAHIEIIGRQEYLKYREGEINKVIAEIDENLSRVKEVLAKIAGAIAYDRRMIGENQASAGEAQVYKSREYNQCVDAGFWSYGSDWDMEWESLYSKNECKQRASRWDSVIAEYQGYVSGWRASLSKNQKNYQDFLELEEMVKVQRSIIQSSKENTLQELGVFIPDDEIKLALDSLNLDGIVDFFDTLTHEYLHYSSYISDERSLPLFFEEGLTEYFSRKVIKHKFNVDTNMGYPLITHMIKEMEKDITEDVLEEIYFTKDVARLQAELDNAYGKDFFEQSEVYLNLILYVSPADALKYANNILVRIGADEASEEVMYSRLSDFK